jgi:hypothetical protein
VSDEPGNQEPGPIDRALQAFVVSRIVERFGMRGSLLALPIVALGAYGTSREEKYKAK